MGIAKSRSRRVHSSDGEDSTLRSPLSSFPSKFTSPLHDSFHGPSAVAKSNSKLHKSQPTGSSSKKSKKSSSRKREPFRLENGRRFHNYPDVPYFLPVDEEEMERLDQMHYAYQELIGDNNIAKLNEPTAIMDLGTGTGIWVLEMAAKYPFCSLSGIDLVPIQPDSIKPPNCEFITFNLLDVNIGLVFPSQTFDYVHQRDLTFGIPPDNWEKIFHDVFRVLKPRGLYELIEWDWRIQGGGEAANRVNELIDQMLEDHQVANFPQAKVPEMLKSIGFQQIEIGVFQVNLADKSGVSFRIWKELCKLLQNVKSRSLPPTCSVSKDAACNGKTTEGHRFTKPRTSSVFSSEDWDEALSLLEQERQKQSEDCKMFINLHAFVAKK